MALVQKGTALEVGIGGYTYTGYIVEDADVEVGADIEDIRGEDNDITTKLISNAHSRVTVNVIGKSGSTLASLKTGDAISLNSVSMMVESVTVKRSRGALKGTIKAVKEGSMTYT